jgi:hypothetical protein
MPASKGDYADLPNTPGESHNYYYDDLECLISEDSLVNSKYVVADVIDHQGYTALTINMIPYLSEGDENYAAELEAWKNRELSFDQSCIN